MSLDPEEFAGIYRREVGRCTATLVRMLGDIDLAEDAVADAFSVAAERWPVDGVPPNPGGWITTTARRRAIDRLRRESTRPGRERAATRLHDTTTLDDDTPLDADDMDHDTVADDQLRLIFLCCHPALAVESQVALTLRLLGGLSTTEIARAFLVADTTMGQRLSRAKRKIRDARVPLRLPPSDQLPERLSAVLAAIYLIYNEGHSATHGDDLVRPALTNEAIRIARTLAELLPDEPEVVGLLALLVLTESRAPARIDRKGNLVPLAEQDRTRWDTQLIDDGHALVRSCITLDRPGPYQLQAAIAAVHADAETAADTDWEQIVSLYDHLLRFRPNAVVALNRAIAVMERDGPEAALEAIDDIDLPGYHLLHAARAEVLRRIGRTREAADALRRAIELTDNTIEIEHLERRLAALDQ